MENSQALTLKPGGWCPDADHWIAQALQHATTAQIRHQVEQGGASVFYVMAGAECVGAFVLRADGTADGSEGVIVAAAGHLPGADLIETCLPQIEKLFINCRRIRYHTARPAMARRLVAHGYAPAEIVCMKEIKNEPVPA